VGIQRLGAVSPTGGAPVASEVDTSGDVSAIANDDGASEGAVMAHETGSTANAQQRSEGFVVWLTGLSGAGKSTLAEALAPELRARGKRVELLDGDIVRTHLSKGLGFSREDRDLNVARIAFVAHLLARNGVVVLVAAVSPFREAREAARRTIGAFVEVHVAPPIEACIERDVKGLYKRALAGEIPQFTGVNDPYEPPNAPELSLDTSTFAVSEGVARILSTLQGLGYLAAPGAGRAVVAAE
jgi:adenylylsulfate kinase